MSEVYTAIPLIQPTTSSFTPPTLSLESIRERNTKSLIKLLGLLFVFLLTVGLFLHLLGRKHHHHGGDADTDIDVLMNEMNSLRGSEYYEHAKLQMD